VPILEVEIVGEVGNAVHHDLARRIAEAAGAALTSRPGRTWVVVRHLPESSYAENGGGPPAGVLPVFVRLLLADPPAGLARSAQAAALTAAIAEACSRAPENVHVLYETAARGRIAFGGKLID